MDYDKQMMATAIHVKDRIRRAAAATDNITPDRVKKVRGAMVGTLNKYLGGDDMRTVTLGWIFASDFEVLSPMSSKVLTDDQVGALVEWLGWWQDDEATWHVGDQFPHEALCVLNAALAAYNQANKTQKSFAMMDPLSLVANLSSMGGVVTAIGPDDLSKIDKSKQEAE